MNELELLAARDPCTLQLAVLASLAVEIEPTLLRRLRCALVPHASPLAESLLWNSELVETCTSRVLLLRDDVLLTLRRELAKDQARLDAARAIVREAHHGIAEVLRCEEDLVYYGMVDLALLPRPELDAARLDALVQERLQQILLSIRHDESRRASLLSWSARALPTLPDRVRTSAAGVTLALTTTNAGSVDDGVIAELLAASDADVNLYVRWSDDLLELGERGEGEPTLRLPTRAPRVLELEQHVADAWSSPVRLLVPHDEPLRHTLTPHTQAIRLRSLRGEGVLLQRA